MRVDLASLAFVPVRARREAVVTHGLGATLFFYAQCMLCVLQQALGLVCAEAELGKYDRLSEGACSKLLTLVCDLLPVLFTGARTGCVQPPCSSISARHLQRYLRAIGARANRTGFPLAIERSHLILRPRVHSFLHALARVSQLFQQPALLQGLAHSESPIKA